MSETREVYDPFIGKTVKINDDLARRLRGQYALGPTMENGEPEFGWQQFGNIPSIQLVAADKIEDLTRQIASRDEVAAGLHAENEKLRRELEMHAKWRDGMLNAYHGHKTQISILREALEAARISLVNYGHETSSAVTHLDTVLALGILQPAVLETHWHPYSPPPVRGKDEG